MADADYVGRPDNKNHSSMEVLQTGGSLRACREYQASISNTSVSYRTTQWIIQNIYSQ